jgi:hypothetical protein
LCARGTGCCQAEHGGRQDMSSRDPDCGHGLPLYVFGVDVVVIAENGRFHARS